MANYYNTVIIPTLPRAPKGKASVKGIVGKVTSKLIDNFRNTQFESIAEVNRAFLIKLTEFNRESFQKREGSRQSVFEKDEKKSLQPLPREVYEFSTWKQATVACNYHISIHKNYYSVPFKTIKHKVEARITSKTVEIYYQGKRLCSHSRLPDGAYQYSSHENHMPDKHQQALEWNGDRFRQQASKIGPQPVDVVNRLLKSYKIEQQGYKGWHSLLQMSKKYSTPVLEQACQQALKYMSSPRYKDIKLILETSQRQNKIQTQDVNKGAYVRGSTYYGGQDSE